MQLQGETFIYFSLTLSRFALHFPDGRHRLTKSNGINFYLFARNLFIRTKWRLQRNSIKTKRNSPIVSVRAIQSRIVKLFNEIAYKQAVCVYVFCVRAYIS